LRATAVDTVQKFSHLHVIAHISTLKFSRAILINDPTVPEDSSSAVEENAAFTSDYRKEARHAEAEKLRNYP